MDLVKDVAADQYSGDELTFTEKADFDPIRPKPVLLKDMSLEERAAFIEKNPEFGQIICRCETISKGEILAAMRRPIPALDLDAIKRRTRSGMGRCQGGFCGPSVVELLKEEMGIDPLEVTKRGGGSKILMGRTKDAGLWKGGCSHEKIQL